MEVDIPGVTKQEFEQWIQELQIKSHPNLSIEKSKLGGYGLFFTANANAVLQVLDNEEVKEKEDEEDEEEEQDDDIEILRIPHCYNLNTLGNLLREVKQRDEQFESVEPKESSIIINFLKASQQSETGILLSYILAFHTIKGLPDSEYHRESPLQQFNVYLQVLSSTWVPALTPLNKKQDDVELDKNTRNQENEAKEASNGETALDFVRFTEFVKEEYQRYIEEVQTNIPNLDITNTITWEVFYQYSQAIRSRILEIPRMVGVEDGEEVYTTDVSLVPILDFANHATLGTNNLYFDIDLETKNIVLNLSQPLNGKFEITISYDPDDTTDQFLFTYGFKN